ncbi:SlyX family protein [Reinekea marina]|uniref:SlyX family protein n=1 Tax=Reinekea marina TaxID=1310421 RepID=A0ABV7WPU3_9GAMM|nr:SlyX family protein [Reinekea marina]MDN3649906.1 SlyX family protein [Reinekea marina]
MNKSDQDVELETRITYMDDTIDQLNDVISRQQLQIDKLERIVQKLLTDHIELKDQLAPEITDTPPPHY